MLGMLSIIVDAESAARFEGGMTAGTWDEGLQHRNLSMKRVALAAMVGQTISARMKKKGLKMTKYDILTRKFKTVRN